MVIIPYSPDILQIQLVENAVEFFRQRLKGVVRSTEVELRNTLRPEVPFDSFFEGNRVTFTAIGEGTERKAKDEYGRRKLKHANPLEDVFRDCFLS